MANPAPSNSARISAGDGLCCGFHLLADKKRKVLIFDLSLNYIFYSFNDSNRLLIVNGYADFRDSLLVKLIQTRQQKPLV